MDLNLQSKKKKILFALNSIRRINISNEKYLFSNEREKNLYNYLIRIGLKINYHFKSNKK